MSYTAIRDYIYGKIADLFGELSKSYKRPTDFPFGWIYISRVTSAPVSFQKQSSIVQITIHIICQKDTWDLALQNMFDLFSTIRKRLYDDATLGGNIHTITRIDITTARTESLNRCSAELIIEGELVE